MESIDLTHLALASQSLSIMIVLIPYIRETFRRCRLNPNQVIMLTEFDKLKRVRTGTAARHNEILRVLNVGLPRASE